MHMIARQLLELYGISLPNKAANTELVQALLIVRDEYGISPTRFTKVQENVP